MSGTLTLGSGTSQCQQVTEVGAISTRGAGAAARTRTYRGLTAGDRQHQRRERLIAAGLELFGTRGIAGTRVDDLCAEAGLTKRYFYESFASPDDLVQAVLERVIENLTAIVVPGIVAGGWRDPAPAIAAGVTALLGDPRLTQLLVVETNSGSLTAYRQGLIDRAVDTWLAADSTADRDPGFLSAQRLLAYAFAGAAGEVAVAWTSGRIDLPAEEIIEHLVRIFRRISPQLHGSTSESNVLKI